MNKSVFVVLAAIISFLVLLIVPDGQTGNPGNQLTDETPSYVPGQLLVKYRAGYSQQACRVVAGAETLKAFEHIAVTLVKLPASHTTEAGMKAFAADPRVEYVEPNYLYCTQALAPNDTHFSLLWGLRNTGQTVNGAAGTPGADIRATEAWSAATGDNKLTIAVIDTGIDYNHPDLAANISAARFNFVDGNTNPVDSHDHGTHVAGTIAAVGNNGTGVTGLCWNSRIIPLKAGNALGILAAGDIISAINFAISNGAKIINASFGGTSYSQAVYDAIDSARNAGILFIAAAGNSSTNNDTAPFYPASYNLDNIIAVAATDQNDALTSFSNFGATKVHVAAPGVNTYSTRPARQTVWTENFDDGNIGDWATGALGATPPAKNTWGLSTTIHLSGTHSLAVSPTDTYAPDADTYARAPAINLSGYSGAKLTFKLNGTSESGYDFLYVETSTNGTTWINREVMVGSSYRPDGISGSTGALWFNGIVDLGIYDGQPTVYVRFRFISDDSVNYNGWFIDDLAVTAASTVFSGTEYQFMNGTSMATPHVAGLAALIWGYSPALTYSQVKTIILDNVDIIPSLSGKVASGGRINAYKALSTLVPAAADNASGAGGGGGGGGGCFIATAAFGSYTHPSVVVLRSFRDAFLLTNAPGRLFVKWYYRISPSLAGMIVQSPTGRAAAQVLLIPVAGFSLLCLKIGLAAACTAVLLFVGLACAAVRKCYTVLQK